MGFASFVFHRAILYSLLWVAAVIELGLTGWRVHHTKSTASFYDPIVVALLVSSILTIIWVPITTFLHVFKSKSLSAGEGYKPLHFESAGNTILWIMWLIEAAIATHKWPTRAFTGSGRDGHVLLTLVAFAWINFGLLSLAKVVVATHYAYLRGAAGTAGATHHEKRETSA
ncbi:uncharacterized protein FOMMEDRAFT_18889 [Fomitiporia mediterranea MF3/22]|uniref:uncharacterized protein n=1 Tax=Fomitiporia mediterranea (strain MF3/22) TaxID=694068 RepID=UPI0004408A6E|nr:uncharacterized protein FOMMEDRAFT_18889 [Fomitiporia mediterranea MF3/22]EJD05296.1 hypothetical protein FOMMEDRAFT_18889 [Fomitiporia mediterranea MF3/22]